jgi:3-deoxy-manno-octulosonate cytidylyltransferase (CMP-KDO synthetase)
MKTVIVIPARYASSRFPGKPLALLRDGSGVAKPLVQRSWEAAMAVPGVAEVHVATDDDRIRDVALGFGANVVMTSSACENGTMRCADALAKGITADLVINLQGDAPLTPPWFVEAIIAHMKATPQAAVATPVVRCDRETFAHFIADRQAGRVGGTTATFAADGGALYFSKEVIPYIDPAKRDSAWHHVFHHVGLYGYRPAALTRYAGFPAGPLETLEGLEQLRFLENGIPIACVEVEARGAVFWELNNPEDVGRIERILART